MCIDDSIGTPDGIYPNVGEIVTVIQCHFFHQNYFVLEYPFGKSGFQQSIRKSRFIPISNIDEKELIKERELVNA